MVPHRVAADLQTHRDLRISEAGRAELQHFKLSRSKQRAVPRLQRALGSRKHLALLCIYSTIASLTAQFDAANMTNSSHTPSSKPMVGLDGMYQFDLGQFRCIAVSDGSFDYAPEMFFENAPVAERDRELRRVGASPDCITTPYTFLVVDTGSARVLVDQGAGDLGPRTGTLPESMRQAGYPPESVDLVVITHAHPDHVGGTLDEAGTLLCPNARYVVTRREWEFWFSPEAEAAAAHATAAAPTTLVDIARGNLSAMETRVALVDRDEELLPGISVIHAPGHTPGHAVVAVQSEGEKLLYTADTVLSPLHLEHPDWLPAVDLLPEEAERSKRRIFGKAAHEQLFVMAQHFPPFPSLGHVTEQRHGWRWTPVAAEGSPLTAEGVAL